MNERERWEMPKSPVIFVPRFVKQNSDLQYGEVVTHENYNEKLNLNGQQGDYNTEILRLLFTEGDAEKAIHIPYLDKIIEQKANEHEEAIAALDERVTENREDIDAIFTELEVYDEQISELQQQVINIIDGTQVVGVAKNLEGAFFADAKQYYGTDSQKKVGFHRVPDSLFADDLDEGYGAYIDGIYIKPRPGSVEEDMLTQEVRDKLNKTYEVITDYDELTGRPRINNIVLTGNLSLDDLDIQQKGNYLTEIPSEFPNDTQVQNMINTSLEPYALSSWLSRYALQDTFVAANNDHETRIINLEKGKCKVYFSAPTNNAGVNEGDLLVTL